MEHERELMTGILSAEANFRLIVSGKIGSKEIDLLIRKLTIDKEILADADKVATGKAAAVSDANDMRVMDEEPI